MTDFITQYAKHSILTILLVSLSASTLPAQFPVEEANKMVGSWNVTNNEDYSIQLQINGQNQFRMLVNGQESNGEIKSSGNVVTLNFSNGTKQEFNKSFDNGQMIFAATKGTQRFVMDRVDVDAQEPATVMGLPGVPPSDDVEEDVPAASPSERILGKWYAKLESDQIEVFIKSEFREDGTYSTSTSMVAGSEKETQNDKGRWAIEDGNLVSVSDGETDPEIAPLQFVDENLELDMTAMFGTRLVMSRSLEQVKPSKFDLRKLIEYAESQADGGK